jgi:hypothetical protein
VGDIEYRRNGNTGVYEVQEEREHWGILSTRGTGGDIGCRRNGADIEYRRNGNSWGYGVQEEQGQQGIKYRRRKQWEHGQKKS